MEYRFEAYTIEGNETKEWVVKFPDLGVIGAGNSFEEAFAEAKLNKDFFLQYLNDSNKTIPQPTLHGDLYDASGKITFRTSKSTHKKIIARAEKEGISINAMLNEAVSTYLEGKSTIEVCKGFFEEFTERTYYTGNPQNTSFKFNFENLIPLQNRG